MTTEREIDRYTRDRIREIEETMAGWIEAKKVSLAKKDHESKNKANALLRDFLMLLAEGKGAGIELPAGWQIVKGS